jgi:hypothetical protein
MSDKKEGFFAQIKNQVIAGVGIVLTTLGGVFIDEVQENNQSVNVEGPTIVVNIPEQQVKEKVIIKEVKVPVEKKKEKEQEIDW